PGVSALPHSRQYRNESSLEVWQFGQSIAPSRNDLVQRVLDEPLGSGALQLRDQIADRSLRQHSFHRYPLLVSEPRNGWALHRRQQINHRLQARSRDVHLEADHSLRIERAFEEENDILHLLALPRI